MMAQDRERVTYVRYGFSSHSLYNAVIPSQHKAEESIEKYAQLCREALQQMYPNAVIDIPYENLLEGVLPASLESIVHVSEDFQEVEDVTEIQVVNHLCERIYSQFDGWLVKKNLIPILESPKYCNLLPAAIRWACMRRLIMDSERYAGFWQVPLDGLLLFSQQQNTLANQLTYKAVIEADYPFLIWEEIGDIKVTQLPDHSEFLVCTRDGFGMNLFTSNASSLRIYKVGLQVELIVEHFVDIVPWLNSRWAYALYVNSLVQQATKLGIEVEYDAYESDGEVISGISLKFRESLSQDISLEQYINEKFQLLSEVISMTELTLKGGLEWKTVYEQSGQEALFCAEILEKLLKEMGYIGVRNTHGKDEYGRDFIFSTTTESGETVYVGLQAKVGNISGGANSLIDKLLGQIEDAFSIPFIRPPEQLRSENHIGIMIIATSGFFTSNAIEKIRHKMPKQLIGSVFFWDQTTIRDLITCTWGRK